MMDQAEPRAPSPAPLWKRIFDFPLVALVVAVALFILSNAAAGLAFRILPPMERDLEAAVRGAIAIGLTLAVYKLAIVRLGERKHDDLPMAKAPKGLAIGVAIGLVLFSAVVGVAALFDVYNIVGEGGTRDLVVMLVGLAIIPGFMEELLFRGILFRWIEEFAGSWAALAITSAMFGFAHIINPNATVFSSLAIAIEAGVMLGAAYMLTRNLWLPIGLHAGWNFTQGQIFDVPVSGVDQNGLVTAELSGPELLSGGAFGLEASVIAMILATGVGLALLLRVVRKGELRSPWWVRRRLANRTSNDEAVA